MNYFFKETFGKYKEKMKAPNGKEKKIFIAYRFFIITNIVIFVLSLVFLFYFLNKVL